jgi:hypothetical protein
MALKHEEESSLCVCGHAQGVHDGACTVPNCTCPGMSRAEDDDADVGDDD